MTTKNENRTGYKRTDIGWIPDDWNYLPLSEVAGIIVSNVDKKEHKHEIPIRLCNYTDVYYNQYIRVNMDFMSASASSAEIEKFSLQKNDVLITKDSETPDDIAVPALVVEEMPGVICGYHLAILRPKDTRIEGGYLSFLLRLQTMRHYFFTLANGVTRFGLSIDAISGAGIPLPPISEQRRIAEILQTWDTAIDRTRRLIEACKRRKKAFMQKLLTGKWRFPMFGKPSKNGELPMGWEWKTIGQLALLVKGQQVNKNTLSKNGTYYVLNGGITPSGYMEKWNTEANTISISEGGNSCGFVNFNGDRFWSGGHCYTLNKISSRICNKYMYFYLKYKESGLMDLRVGTGLPNIQRNAIEKFVINFPPLPEQVEIAGFLTALDSEIAVLQKYLEKLSLQETGLMQKLLTGEIRV